ncbi:hypothetical protein ACFW9N_21630 [Streptomyces sp. NPDC059496]|uniref:hypothetical protein n=1 Tax=Streptomyces sp. NPDC059496 TaxID=3346851 RepID=UPI0036A8B6D4
MAGHAEVRGRTGDAGPSTTSALDAGDTLVRAARVEGCRAARPAEVGGGEPQLRPAAQWCSGPAGNGTFLIRLWSATGQRRFADLAERAAATSEPSTEGPNP